MAEVGAKQLKINRVFNDKRWDKNLLKLTKEVSFYLLESLGAFNNQSEIEFTINYSNDKELRELNHKFRNKDSATNVLSFPAMEVQDYHNLQDSYIGDIAISYETVLKESQEADKPFTEHYIHLIIHSILHLLGFDHINEDEAILMETEEVRVLKHFGFEDPY